MYTHILLAVDLEDEASWSKALPMAVEYCKAFDSTLHVITVAPSFGMTLVGQFFPAGYEKQVEDTVLGSLREFVRQHVPKGVRVQNVVSQGTIYKEILDAAERIGCDLIVMASHQPELADYLLGPNAARVVRHASCSVLVVRN